MLGDKGVWKDRRYIRRNSSGGCIDGKRERVTGRIDSTLRMGVWWIHVLSCYFAVDLE
jgi:hypothetical protein